MSTIAELEDSLDKEDLLAKPGKGGIRVAQVEDGFLLFNSSKDGSSRNFSKEQIAKLLKLFPKLSASMLERFLVRNSDSSRRARMLEERRKSSYTNFQSLDDGRPMPAIGSVDARNPENIPRLYSALDMSDSEHPTLVLWGSEWPVEGGKLRLDEAMFLVDVDPEDAKRIQTGEDPRVVLKTKKVQNPRVLYYDDNKVIHGESRLKHHLKSFDSLRAWAAHAFGQLGVTTENEIFLHVEDDFGDSPAVLMTENELAELERRKPGLKPPGAKEQRFYLSMKLKAEFESGKFKALTIVKGSRFGGFIRQMGMKDRKKMSEALDKLIAQFNKTLSHIPKE
jgi:hypothetical protein